MINLLPDEKKAEIRAARTNVLLVRYIGILLSAIIVLSGLVAGSYVVLNTTRDSAQAKVDAGSERVGEYQTTNQQAESFRKDLATAKSILDQKISFAKLIYKIADIVPANVILDGLVLDPSTFGSKMTLSASAKSFQDASMLKDALKSHQDVFSNVQLQSIQSDGDSGSSAYPIKVSIDVVINRGAAQ